MALLEEDAVLVSTTEDGTTKVVLPISRANNIEGLGRYKGTQYTVGDTVYVDSNMKIALACITGGVTSQNEIDFTNTNAGETIQDGGVVWLAINRGVFVGASSTTNGASGLVPAPSAGAKNRYLNAYGDFDEIDVPVKSVNGQTGDVVVDVGVNSINGQKGDVTIPVNDGTVALKLSGDMTIPTGYVVTKTVTGLTPNKPMHIYGYKEATTSGGSLDIDNCTNVTGVDTGKLNTISAILDKGAFIWIVIPTATTVAITFRSAVGSYWQFKVYQ